MNIRKAPLLALITLALATTAAAQLTPAHARGFDPEKVYQVGDLDHINLFNGNLILSLPIGPTLPVGGNLSYGLHLVYNGNPWNYRIDHGVSEAIPSRFSNAGLGWQLTLGQLVAPGDPLSAALDDGGWIYAAPDGAERVFWPQLHPVEETGTPYAADGTNVMGYTRDGTYLRLVRIGAQKIRTVRGPDGNFTAIWVASYKIEFPDGAMHTFTSEEWEDEVAAPTISEMGLRYRLTRMEDRFGNWVQVAYSGISADLPNGSAWTITDSVGRTSAVTFTSQTYYQYRGGAQSAGLVETVTVPAFGSGSATYHFNYSPYTRISMPRGDSTKPAFDQNSNPLDQDTYVRFLNSVTLPQIPLTPVAQYSMDYTTIVHGSSLDPGKITAVDWAGHILGLSLPTGGRLEWEPATRRFPAIRADATDDASEGSSVGASRDFSAAVGIRHVKANGQDNAWSYVAHLGNLAQYAGISKNGFPTTKSVAQELVVLVTDPLQQTTANYFNAYVGGGSNCFASPSLLEYGLPFTRSAGTDIGILKLTSESFDGQCTAWSHTVAPGDPNGCATVGSCISAGGTVLAAKRRNYVAYESDRIGSIGASHHESDRNWRVLQQGTRYLDDPLCDFCYSVTAWSDFDGLGHYRTERHVTNFMADSISPGGATQYERKTVTHDNANPAAGEYVGEPIPGAPGPDPGPSGPSDYMIPTTAPWITGVFDSVSTTENGVTASEYDCFDTTTGALRGKRVLSGPAAAPNDLISTLTRDARGNVISEKYYGGDLSPLPPTASSCTGTSTPEYEILHTYAGGSLESTRYASAPFKSLDLIIDIPTGLPSAGRDSAGVSTTYAYDLLGRLTEVHPQDEAWTAYSYSYPTSTVAASAVTAKRWSLAGGSDPITEDRFYFDGLGRLTQQKHRMPDGSGQQWSTTLSVFDPLGRKSAVSTPFYRPSPDYEDAGALGIPLSFTTTAYDLFGRPKNITAPDGSAANFSWTGVRELTRTSSINTPAGPANISAKEIYDGFGRLVAVKEHSANDAGEVATNYTYDVGNRLTHVATNAIESAASPILSAETQTRDFAYDQRGFLLWEKHPEKGANGYGTVRYGWGIGNDDVIPAYDSRGHLHRRVEGIVDGPFDLAFDYDAFERLVSVTEADPASNSSPKARRPVKELTFADSLVVNELAVGKLASATRHNRDPRFGDVTITDSFHYSSLPAEGGVGGRLTRRHTDVATTGGFAGASFEVSQKYTELGNILSLTYPTCLDSACASAAPARTTTNGYTNGLLTSVGSYVTALSYQANGMPDVIQHGPSLTEKWTPDPNGMSRPCSVLAAGAGSVLNGSGTDICHTVLSTSGQGWTSGRYVYDGSGNIRQIGVDLYGYDAAGRLASSTIGGALTRYSYDAFGNLGYDLPVDTQSDDFIAHVRPSWADPASNHLRNATYDAAGNVTLMKGVQDPPNAFQYSWDSTGSMKALRGPLDIGLAPISTTRDEVYLYNADDERLARVVLVTDSAGVTSNRTTWSVRGFSNQLLRSWTDDATTGTRLWIWNEDEVFRGATVIANLSPAGTRHYVTDHLGSPRAVFNDAGQLLGTQQFAPFGQGGATGAGALQFTAHERDFTPTSDTLDYMHARYYTAGWGRFLSVDPVRGRANQAQSWNSYSYVRNNALNSTDPDGRDTVGDQNMERDDRDFLAGRLSADEYKDRQVSRAAGAIAGAAIVAIGVSLYDLFHADSVEAPTITNNRAQEVADDAQQGGRTSGTAASFKPLDGTRHDATSGANPEHPTVKEIMSGVPSAQRSPFHGKCAEPACVSKALNSGSDPSGGEIQTARIRKAGNPQHGTPNPPCSSCEFLLRWFNIKYQ
ncbi:MAG: hypothetical protein JWN02_1231 [Acidobacteria bacterium]|nr:hypothetical protein [Acidobacteriota bacterium]